MIEPATRLRYVPFLVLFILFLVPTISATGQIGAYNVEITDEYVSSDSRCSCSYGTWYQHIHAEFVNYCPGCKHHGTLLYECNGVGYSDYARSDEGMWYCGSCDRDFCSQCGFTHGKYNSGNWLIPYEKPPEIIEPVYTEQQIKQQKFKDLMNYGNIATI